MIQTKLLVYCKIITLVIMLQYWRPSINNKTRFQYWLAGLGLYGPSELDRQRSVIVRAKQRSIQLWIKFGRYFPDDVQYCLVRGGLVISYKLIVSVNFDRLDCLRLISGSFSFLRKVAIKREEQVIEHAKYNGNQEGIVDST